MIVNLDGMPGIICDECCFGNSIGAGTVGQLAEELDAQGWDISPNGADDYSVCNRCIDSWDDAISHVLRGGSGFVLVEDEPTHIAQGGR